MNVLIDFVKNTLLKQASFDLHHLSAIYLKKKKLYIFCIFWDFSYTDFSMGKFRVVFRDILFFFGRVGGKGGGRGGVEGAPSLQIFLAIRPRVCGESAFPEDFLAGNCVKFLYFCSGCHYLLYLLVCLLSVYFLLLLLLLLSLLS